MVRGEGGDRRVWEWVVFGEGEKGVIEEVEFGAFGEEHSGGLALIGVGRSDSNEFVCEEQEIYIEGK